MGTLDRAVGRTHEVSFVASAHDGCCLRDSGPVDGCARGAAGVFPGDFTDPSHRNELLREGWKAVSKVVIVAVVMDVIYEYLVFRWFIPERR
jgi:hypothetical protein